MMFSLASAIAYVLAYYFNLSLFEYYPTTNEIRFGAQLDQAEQTVHIYGWIVSSALAGGVLTLAIPKKWTARIPPDTLWALALVLIVAVVMYERRWFF